MMDYMTARDAAEKWNISQRRVSILCSEERIPGSAMLGNMWLIPKEAEKPTDGRTIRFAKEKHTVLKPFVKWAGGKGQLFNEIEKLFPDEFGYNITKYAEPFIGGGAVLFNVLSNYNIEQIYISDINKELINTYRVIKSDVYNLVNLLHTMEHKYLPLDSDERKAYFYAQRDLFNSLKALKDENENVELAALFIFLNRTCFNGLYRVNKSGQYNVPIGSYKNPAICDEKNLINISKALKSVVIQNCDYHQSEDFIDENTLVYFDPPYRPLSKTAGFTSFTENCFNDDDQIKLARYISKLAEKGAKIIVSNSDPKNSNPDDNFFDILYASHRVSRVSASRMINSNSDARGKISELLITTF